MSDKKRGSKRSSEQSHQADHHEGLSKKIKIHEEPDSPGEKVEWTPGDDLNLSNSLPPATEKATELMMQKFKNKESFTTSMKPMHPTAVLLSCATCNQEIMIPKPEKCEKCQSTACPMCCPTECTAPQPAQPMETKEARKEEKREPTKCKKCGAMFACLYTEYLQHGRLKFRNPQDPKPCLRCKVQALCQKCQGGLCGICKQEEDELDEEKAQHDSEPTPLSHPNQEHYENAMESHEKAKKTEKKFHATALVKCASCDRCICKWCHPSKDGVCSKCKPNEDLKEGDKDVEKCANCQKLYYNPFNPDDDSNDYKWIPGCASCSAALCGKCNPAQHSVCNKCHESGGKSGGDCAECDNWTYPEDYLPCCRKFVCESCAEELDRVCCCDM